MVSLVKVTKTEQRTLAQNLFPYHYNRRYILPYFHTEVGFFSQYLAGWLEPLLDEIHKNKTTVVTPVIDVIDDTTLQLQYGSATSTSLGGFDWGLQFNWHAIPDRELKRRKSEVRFVIFDGLAEV